MPDPMPGTVLVEWRRAVCCRERLLRVSLSPTGWHLKVDGFRVHLKDWAERTGMSDDDLTARERGELVVFDARTIRAPLRTLPHDLDEWPAVRFEVGCDHHTEYHPLGDLAADCAESKRTRRKVQRRVEPVTGGLSVEEFTKKYGVSPQEWRAVHPAPE